MNDGFKETAREHDPPEIAAKLADAVFKTGIFASILLVCYAAYRIYDPRHSVYYYCAFLILGAILVASFYVGLKLRDNLKVNLSLLILSIAASVYLLEIYLECFRRDFRTKVQVIADLRKAGIDAYPAVYPSLFTASNGLITKGGAIFPLGGISHKTTVLGKEGGSWSIYESDEHGFNNPKGLYKKKGADIVLIGDSFCEGYGVKPNENIAAVIRKSGPKVINFSKGGSGPLAELGRLKEYAEVIRPKIVLLGYFEGNDLYDLQEEMKSPLLMGYLNDDDFNQNLISKQAEIDHVTADFVEQNYRRYLEGEDNSEHFFTKILDTSGFAVGSRRLR